MKNLTNLLFCFLILLLQFSCTTKQSISAPDSKVEVQSNYDQLLSKSEHYIEKGKMEKAKISLAKCIEIDPSEIKGLYLSGFVYARDCYEKGINCEFGRAYLDEVIAQDEHYRYARYNRGLCAMMMGDTEQALKDFNYSLKKNPGDMDALVNHSVVLHKTGESEKAMEQLNTAVKSSSSNSSAYNSRGTVHLENQRIVMAIKDFDKAIKMSPDVADFYLNRGLCYIKNNNLDLAMNDFNVAVQLAPNSYNNYFQRGKLLQQAKLHKKANLDFDKAILLGGHTGEIYYHRAKNLYWMEEYDAAKSDFEKVQYLDPNFRMEDNLVFWH